MRILIINPNTTESVTELLAQSARRVAAPQTELVPLTAPRGFPYISTRAEAQIGGALVIEMLAQHRQGADAAIVAAFGDPGLFALRELFDIPVVGMSEAAMLTARMLGRRFSVVTFSQQLVPWYRDCVDMHGMGPYCAAVRALDESFTSVANVQNEKGEHLVELAIRTVNDDGADVIILGGAPLAGLGHSVRDRIPVPIVDPVGAAVKQAEALVSLGVRKAVAGGFKRPVAKATSGLEDAVAAVIEHRDFNNAAE